MCQVLVILNKSSYHAHLVELIWIIIERRGSIAAATEVEKVCDGGQ